MAGVRSYYTTPTGPQLLIDVAQAPHTHHGRYHHDSRPTATGWYGACARVGSPQGAVPPPGLTRMGVGGAPVSWLACVHTTPRQQAHGY